MRKLKIKEWFYEKTQDTAARYNCFVDTDRDENGCTKVEDGFVTVHVLEILAESEKAIQVLLDTGSIVGSVKGWRTWIPKSVIA